MHGAGGRSIAETVYRYGRGFTASGRPFVAWRLCRIGTLAKVRAAAGSHDANPIGRFAASKFAIQLRVVSGPSQLIE
jgi:hypothetical protein